MLGGVSGGPGMRPKQPADLSTLLAIELPKLRLPEERGLVGQQSRRAAIGAADDNM